MMLIFRVLMSLDEGLDAREAVQPSAYQGGALF